MAELPPSCALWLVITAGTTTPAAWSDGQSRPAEDHLQTEGVYRMEAAAGASSLPLEVRTGGRNARLGHRHMPMRPSTAATRVAAWQAANAGTTGLRWVAVRRFFAKEALPVATAPLRASTVPVMPRRLPLCPLRVGTQCDVPPTLYGRHSASAGLVSSYLGEGPRDNRRLKALALLQRSSAPLTAWRRTVGTATPSHCPPAGVLELPTSGARFVMLEVAGAQAEKNRLSPSG